MIASPPPAEFLILYGWQGSGPDHWQSHLARDLAASGARVHYPDFPAPELPTRAAWLPRLREVLAECGDPRQLTVVTHSLGGLLWLWAAREKIAPVVKHLILVAPPSPASRTAEIQDFLPAPTDPSFPLARQQDLIASDNDPYVPFADSRRYAQRLIARLGLLPGAGHLNTAAGYGRWPWLRDYLTGVAAWPPQPSPAARAQPSA